MKNVQDTGIGNYLQIAHYLNFHFLRNSLGFHGKAGWLLHQPPPKPKDDLVRLHGLDRELWMGQLHHPLPGAVTCL